MDPSAGLLCFDVAYEPHLLCSFISFGLPNKTEMGIGSPSSHIKKEDLDAIQGKTQCKFYYRLFVNSRKNRFAFWSPKLVLILVDSKELRTIYKQFRKETPTGVIGKAELREFMKQMNISDPFIQDVVFRM